MCVIVIVVLFVFSPGLVRAQRSELGGLAGMSFYLGDLNQKKLFDFKDHQVHASGGFLYRYNISPRFAIKADFIFGKLSAADSTSSRFKNADMSERNLNFTSKFTEFAVEGELNFFKLYNSTGKNRFSPYIFAGIAVFSYDPMTTYNGIEYHLQSLGTEGQGLEGGPEKKYSLTSVAIPFGIGIKVTMGRHFALGAEWGMRYTFTDYIDDIGGIYYDNELLRDQRGNLVADLADRRPELTDPETGDPMPNFVAGHSRGNVKTKDAYSFAGITLTVRFGNEDRICDLKVPRKPRH